MNENGYTPVLPFEDSSFENYIIYNNVTYRRDIDLTEPFFSKDHQSNLIKYYTTQSKEQVKIGGD